MLTLPINPSESPKSPVFFGVSNFGTTSTHFCPPVPPPTVLLIVVLEATFVVIGPDEDLLSTFVKTSVEIFFTLMIVD